MRDCFLCGGKGSFYARVESHDYLRCGGCGLIHVDSVEPAEKLYRSYDGGFWKSLRRKWLMPLRSFSGARHFRESMGRAHRIFDQVLSLAAPQGPKPAFLDIGCNKGFLLAAALSHGWDVHGVEIVPELTLPFKRRYPQCASQIHSMDFKEAQAQWGDGVFDTVTAIDVVEHFEDPLQDVKNIHRIMKKGGILLIQTPDTDHPKARESGGKWGALKPLEHLQLFNRQNLKLLAEKIGFEWAGSYEAFDTEDGNLVAAVRK